MYGVAASGSILVVSPSRTSPSHRFTSRSWQRRCAPLAAKSAGRSSESDLRAGLDPVLRPREPQEEVPGKHARRGGSGSAVCLWRSSAARAILALVIIESVTHGPRRLAGPARRSRADARHRVRAVRRGRYNLGGLITEHGADMRLPDLLATLANCENARAFSIYDRCKAWYVHRPGGVQRVMAPVAASPHRGCFAWCLTPSTGPSFRYNASARREDERHAGSGRNDPWHDRHGRGRDRRRSGRDDVAFGGDRCSSSTPTTR
jgi:hypothetical protein